MAGIGAVTEGLRDRSMCFDGKVLIAEDTSFTPANIVAQNVSLSRFLCNGKCGEVGVWSTSNMSSKAMNTVRGHKK